MKVKNLELDDFDIFAEQIANAVFNDSSTKNNKGLLLESYLEILRSKILKKMEELGEHNEEHHT